MGAPGYLIMPPYQRIIATQDIIGPLIDSRYSVLIVPLRI